MHTHTHTHFHYSNYNLTTQSVDAEYHDTQALDGVWRATWQLVLAMSVKGLITIFTFGIKVYKYSFLIIGLISLELWIHSTV